MADSIYMPHQDKTYIYDDKDNLVSILPGRTDPAKVASEIKSKNSLKGPSGGAAARSQVSKDILVDLASQIPFAVAPGAGSLNTAKRVGGSFLSGLISDQALSKMFGQDRSVGDSAWDAGVNSAVSGTINHFVENKPTMNSIANAKGWGFGGKLLGSFFKLLQGEPRLPEVPATTPVLRLPSGQYTSNKVAWQQYQDYLAKKSILDRISNALGFGANSAIDLANKE